MDDLKHELHYGSRVVRAYTHRPKTVGDMFLATVAQSPMAEAIVDGDRRFSYRELGRRVHALAASLSHQGLRKGDRLALILGNRSEFVETILACALLGAVAVPIGTRLQRQEVEYIVNHSGACMLVHEALVHEALPAPSEMPGIRTRFAIGASLPGVTDFDALFDAPAEAVEAVVQEDDLFLIAYTSGTTGKPKGAMVTHLSAIHACLNWSRSMGVEGPETAVLAIPASHLGGTGGVILPIIYYQGKLVLMREFKTRPFLELAQAERMTYGVFVPTIYNLCLLDPEFSGFDLSCWRWGIYSGAPMPESTIRKLKAALPQLNMINAYGATEATSAIAVMPPHEGLDRLEYVGRTVACGDIIVMGDDNLELPYGEVGELWIAGPMMVSGYWADEAATRSSFLGGYWKSGDMGSITADGYVRVFDRRKEMINRGGMKVFAAEVENILNEHPDVVEAAVLGQPDPVLGERVRAVVVVRTTVDADDIRRFCRQRLADYKTPEFIRVQQEPLPRNANGKVLKRVLAEEEDATCRA